MTKPVHNINPDAAMVDKAGMPTPEGKLIAADMRLLAERSGGVMFGWQLLPAYALANLPTAAPAWAVVICTDESGGAVPVFKDASGDWRRVTDRAIAT